MRSSLQRTARWPHFICQVRSGQADDQLRILEWFDHYLKGKEAEPWIDEEIPWLEQKEAGGRSR